MKTRSHAIDGSQLTDRQLPRTLRRSLLLVGLGVLAAGMDLATAAIYWAPQGISFLHLLRSIASWLLGPRPPETALVYAIGLLSHLLIYVSLALIFDLLLARRRHQLAHRFMAGALFGALAYVLVFRLLVPALVFPITLNQSPAWVGTCVLVHVLVIGPMLAWGLTRKPLRSR